MGSTVPGIDAGARQRLTARFGSQAKAWFDELPGVLTVLAQRWQLELGTPIPRGSMSAVFRCRRADGRRAVLKASPDRARLAFEAAALDAWHTVHTPAVIALDEQLGALLIEAIEPGTPLDLSLIYPAADSVAALLNSLHESGVPDPSYPAVGQHVTYLFGSSAKLYERHPELAALIPPELYERGHRLATRLARHDSPVVLLHGDLTPSNILDGGAERGLVAIDPAPCLAAMPVACGARALGTVRAGNVSPDPCHDLVCTFLGDLDELVIKVAALCGDQHGGAFPDEILTECLIPPTTGFEVDAPENASRLLAAT